MTGGASYPRPPAPAFLFDLDGTLIDSVYQHVIAWREALSGAGIDLSVWRIHRRIGMSGGLFMAALIRETGIRLSAADADALQAAHAREYLKLADSVRPLPGAAELLATLTARDVRWAIATSGRRATAQHALDLLGLPPDAPMITRDVVAHAKPDPDLFLAAAALLEADPGHCLRGRRQRLGPAGGPPGRVHRGGPDVGRLRPRGTGAGRRLPRLLRPGRPAGPGRRAGRARPGHLRLTLARAPRRARLSSS